MARKGPCRAKNGRFKSCGGGSKRKRKSAGSKRKSVKRKKPCKFGVNKRTGSCLKHKRRKR